MKSTRKFSTIITPILTALVMLTVLFLVATPALANPPSPEGPDFQNELPPLDEDSVIPNRVKALDQPNAKDYLRLKERQRLLDAGETALASSLALTGTDRILVVLVEYAGTDVFTWTAGTSTWDPIGEADPDEAVYDEEGNLLIGNCSGVYTKVAELTGSPVVSGTEVQFTYGPLLFNEIPRPLSAEDRSGDSIWTDDFSMEWYEEMLFGNGVTMVYTREDNSMVNEDFTGQSVTDYFMDLSSDQYMIDGDIVKVQLPHSAWWYGADECPGRRSPYDAAIASGGAIPDAGTARTLVKEAMDAVNAISDTLDFTFDWANYDIDDDGIVDRLWIVHAGFGEEDGTELLNRTSYGEAAIWSHSSQVTPAYSVTQDITVGPYIVMPENGGIGVFAHEYAHNLGAWDLYAYGNGDTSAGFWALQADDWTGFPIGYEPPAADPMHLDMWGWLEPMVITDAAQSYEFVIGQASDFDTIPSNETYYRGAKIQLPAGQLALKSPVWEGDYYWWGGKADLANPMMTTKDPIAVSAGDVLTFDIAYDIEDGGWDFLWVQVSEDGTNWDTLTNDDTQCETDSGWIGGQYGFPDDLCGAGLGGFYGHNDDFPTPETQTFDVSAYVGSSVYLRFWYMTDWGTTGFGPFIDNVTLGSFSDNAEAGDANWDYAEPWQRTNGTQNFDHNLYLQWRNVSTTGGYDSALGDSRWRFGPANTGLLVWYNNNFYSDNEIYNYLEDDYGFGPKGSMLVIDSHPEPYRDPEVVSSWLGEESTNITTRSQMRDAPFSLWDTVNFNMEPPYVVTDTAFMGRNPVSMFSDSYGYYPGVASEGDGTYYSTIDWDASAAVPARSGYGVKADADYPGFHIQYVDGSGWLGFWGDEGTTGNPGDYGAQYGWNVEIVNQTDMTATIRVYNQVIEFTPTYTPAEIMLSEAGNFTVTYQMVVENTGSTTVSDINVNYILDSNLYVLNMDAGGEGTLNFPATTSWQIDMMDPGDVVTITLVAGGSIEQNGTFGTGLLPEYVYQTTAEASAGGGDFGPWNFPTTVQVPTISFVSPQDGDAIGTLGMTATIPITVAIPDFFVIGAPTDTTADGHWMLYVDESMVGTHVTTYTTSVDLPLGEHTLMAKLVNPDHEWIGPMDEITIEVVNYNLFLPIIMKNYSGSAEE